jgi:malonate-semialdehyde dehydrogenase (acetylating)/methylmalonate-semialdehyde dehydrogenase
MNEEPRNMDVIRHWIDGSAWDADPERTGNVYNPATGAVEKHVALATVAEVDATVAAAQAAYPGWRDTPLTRRQKIMFAFREAVDRNRHDLAKMVSVEHGKTVDDAMGEIVRGLEVIEFATNVPHLMKGEHSENVSAGIDTYTINQPLGVCAGITPFNFPLMVPMWMYPMAIATGNTFVLKPSEKDPSTATRWRWTGCSSIPTSRPSPSSVPHRSPSTSTRTALPTESASRPWPAPRTT